MLNHFFARNSSPSTSGIPTGQYSANFDPSSGMGDFSMLRSSSGWCLMPKFTRSSKAYGYNSTGTAIVEYANDVRRYNYGGHQGQTGNRGYYSEGASTNYLRNPRAEGSVQTGTLETGGTAVLPTYWTGFGSVSGISRSVVGYGVDNGIPYMDIRCVGTYTGGGNAYPRNDFDNDYTNAPCAVGDQWVFSIYSKIVDATDITGLSAVLIGVGEHNSSGSRLSYNEPNWINDIFSQGVGPDVPWTRTHSGRTFNNVNGVYARGWVVLTLTNGSPVDFTIRFGFPQLEKLTVQNSVPTSPILPPVGSPAITTRAAETYELTLTQIGNNQPRYDYDLSTGEYMGVLHEPASTNFIRNSTMAGGGVGTNPTNWSRVGASGIAVSIVDVGIENGINYIDVRWDGTGTSTGYPRILPETSTGIAGSIGERWTFSTYAKVIAGTLFNKVRLCLEERASSGGGFLTNSSTIIPLTSSVSKYSFSRTISNSSTGYIQPYVYVDVANGDVIDMTIRFYGLQCELGSFATSFIPTSSTAVTRAAEYIPLTVLPSWFKTTTGGTISCEFKTLDTSSTAWIFGASNNSDVTKGYSVRLSGGNMSAFIGDNSGTTQVDLLGSTASMPLGNSRHHRVALTWGTANDAAASFDGSSAVTATSVANPTNMTHLYVGSGISSNRFNGWIRRIDYAPARITDSVLPSYSLPRPNKVLDFLSVDGMPSLDSSVSFSRASRIGWTTTSAGVMGSPDNNTPRFEYDMDGNCLGVRMESATTNRCLYSRDFTKSVWTASNMTVAQDQKGLDGRNNTCSSLTATSNGATISQTCSGGSTSYVTSVYMKRLSGIGTIEISIDGTNWTAVTIRSDRFTRVWTPTVTMADPLISIRMSTSGDSIAVDAAQVENKGFPTGYVPTYSVMNTRATEFMTATAPAGLTFTEGTFIAEYSFGESVNSGASYRVFSMHNGSGGAARIFTAGNPFNGSQSINVFNANAPQAVWNSSDCVVGKSYRSGVAWRVNDFNAVFNGTVSTLDTSGAIPSGSLNVINLGWEQNFAQILGLFKRASMYYYRVPDAALPYI